MNKEMTEDEVLELHMYCSLHNDELSELVNLLIMMERCTDYMLGDKFAHQLDAEMRLHLQNYKENTKIIKNTETHVSEWEELEWLQVE